MNMTDEEILSAAEACGMMLISLGLDKKKVEFCILAFAKFVGEIERFKEREACAKVCEQIDTAAFGGERPAPNDCAAAIRARGEYKSHPSGVECIQITEHMNFCLGNAIKYIWRAGLKSNSEIEDLRKARWYIDREIQRIIKENT